MQMYIVFGVFFLFVALILSGKVKIHVAAMMIPIILEITGILKFSEAWAGLSNSSVIMMASMFVVGSGVGKTSLISKLSRTVIKPGSSDFVIMIGIAIPMIFLCCFVNATATMTIMIPMITIICAEQKKSLSKFMYPAAIVAQLWAGAIPTGGNAGGYLGNNTIIENLGGAGTFTYFTDLIAKVPALILVTLILMFISVKIAPDNGNVPVLDNKNAVDSGKKKSSELTPGQEKITIFIFTATIIGIVACALTGLNTWYPSLAGAFFMVLTGVLSDREAIRSMGSPVIFIFVGTLPLSTALKSTGGDIAIADVFNQLTGGMSPFMIMVSMYLLCMVLTQFITNSAVSNAFKTMAALIAVQNGYDARALMLAVTQGSQNCYLTPMAAPAMTMGFESGGYTSKQFFKQGILLSLVRFVAFVIWVPFVFPLK